MILLFCTSNKMNRRTRRWCNATWGNLCWFSGSPTHNLKLGGPWKEVWVTEQRKIYKSYGYAFLRMDIWMSVIGKDTLYFFFPITVLQEPRTSSPLTQLKWCLVVWTTIGCSHRLLCRLNSTHRVNHWISEAMNTQTPYRSWYIWYTISYMPSMLLWCKKLQKNGCESFLCFHLYGTRQQINFFGCIYIQTRASTPEPTNQVTAFDQEGF